MADQPKIGPTGEFPFGAPMTPQDRGSGYAGFRVIRERVVLDGKSYRLCEFAFGTRLSYLDVPITQVQLLAKVMRARIKEIFGEVSYDKTKLESETGIRVTIFHGPMPLIRITLPKPSTVLVADPEIFLSIADHIDDRVLELRGST